MEEVLSHSYCPMAVSFIHSHAGAEGKRKASAESTRRKYLSCVKVTGES